MNKILFCLGLVLLTGCVGPLVSHETARTVGKGHHEIMAGYGSAGFVTKWNMGLMERWDFGVQLESLTLGVRTKFAFIDNQEEGISLAAALGTGTSIGGSHYYADLMASYLAGHFEPYATFRYVRMHTDPIEFRNSESGAIDWTIGSGDFSYGHIIIGSRFWFTRHLLFSVEVSEPVALSSELTLTQAVLVGAALGYRF